MITPKCQNTIINDFKNALKNLQPDQYIMVKFGNEDYIAGDNLSITGNVVKQKVLNFKGCWAGWQYNDLNDLKGFRVVDNPPVIEQDFFAAYIR